MEINTSSQGGVIIVSVSGSIDALTAESLSSALSERINSGKTRLILDLGGVEYSSSAGLRAILGAQKEIRQIGGDLRLSAAQPNVLKVLKLSGFTSIFRSYDSTAAAVASFTEE